MKTRKPDPVVDALRKARRLITPKSRWTQNEYFADANGQRVHTVQDAEKFCALGAILMVSENLTHRFTIFDYACSASMHLFKRPLDTINDSRNGHAKVLKVFDYAIQQARAKHAKADK